MSPHSSAAAPGKPPPHALLRPRIVLPFLLVAAIWGSTWYVITGQIAEAPPSWTIAYRFAIATPAMFAVALLLRKRLRLNRAEHVLAAFVGFAQFCGNFNFVYRAELHLTSGIVATMFGLLIVPNAIFARWLLDQPITRRFLAGSAVAMGGIALLLIYEARVSPLGGDVPLGVVLAIGGILSASIANVVQANQTGRAVPMASLIAWAMFYGTLCDIALAWATAGPPVFPTSGAFWAGTIWLGIAGSVVTFPLYYNIVRELGAGRAAYNSIAVIVVAMVISTLLEAYRWTPLTIAGGVLATLGMLLALRARRVKV